MVSLKKIIPKPSHGFRSNPAPQPENGPPDWTSRQPDASQKQVGFPIGKPTCFFSAGVYNFRREGDGLPRQCEHWRGNDRIGGLIRIAGGQ